MRQNVRRRSTRLLLVPVLFVLVTGTWYLYSVYSSVDLAEIRQAVETGDLETAHELLARLCRNEPDNIDSHVLIADICERLGDPHESIEWLESLEYGPDHSAWQRSKMRAASMCIEHSFPDRAIAVLDQILTRDGRYVPAKAMQIRLDLLLRNQPAINDSVEQLALTGSCQLNDVLLRFPGGDIRWDDPTYVDWLDQARLNEPRNLQVVAALIHVIPRQDRDDDAKKLLHQHRNDAEHCWQLALAAAERHFANKAYTLALNVLNNTEPTAEKSAQVWMIRGRSLLKLDQTDLAKSCFRNAMKIDPTDAAPVQQLLQLAPDNKLTHQLNLLTQYSDLSKSILESQHASFVHQQEIAQLFEQLNLSHAARIANPTQIATTKPQELWKPGLLIEIDLKTSLDPALPGNISTLTPVGTTDIQFERAEGSRQPNFHRRNLESAPRILLRSIGGGVAALDYDRDEWPDLYFSQGLTDYQTSPSASSSHDHTSDNLLRNERGKRHVNIGHAAGIGNRNFSHGVTVGDVNEDGFPDIFVCNFGSDTLLINLGDGTFAESTALPSTMPSQWSTSAVLSDLDRDGDNDLYVVRYVEADLEQMLSCERNPNRQCRPNDFPATRDLIYENLGDGRFRDASHALGDWKGKGLAVTAIDFNQDGWQDLFVGNDTTANLMLENHTAYSEDGQLAFKEVAHEVGVAVGADGYPQACMGIAKSDTNHDGRPDLLVTNYEFEPNSMYINYGTTFLEEARQFRLAAPGWRKMGWGSQFIDVNNDSWDDLILVNSHLYDQPMMTDVFFNRTGQHFEHIKPSHASIPGKRMGRGLATLDWNNDGKRDVIITDLAGQPDLYLNKSQGRQARNIRLIGRHTSRDAGDSILQLVSNEAGEIWKPGPLQSGFLTTNSSQITVPPDCEVLIHWPSGNTTRIDDEFESGPGVFETDFGYTVVAPK